MDVSVAFVILNFKSFQDTIKLTREILDFKQDDHQIIIVDNASPNESYEILNKTFVGVSNVSIIQNSCNNGYAKGNNFGLRYAKRYNPEYVCIINNDVHFTFQTISNLCEWYNKLPNPAIISPIQKLPTGEIAPLVTLDIPTLLYDIRTYTILFQPHIHKYKQNTEIESIQKVGIIPGAFLFTNFKLFESLGFFDEDTFLFCEERFLGKKIANNELNNYIILNEYYIHEHSKTISKESSKIMQQEYLFEGKKKYWNRYSKVPRLIIFLLATLRLFNAYEIRILKKIKLIFR